MTAQRVQTTTTIKTTVTIGQLIGATMFVLSTVVGTYISMTQKIHDNEVEILSVKEEFKEMKSDLQLDISEIKNTEKETQKTLNQIAGSLGSIQAKIEDLQNK